MTDDMGGFVSDASGAIDDIIKDAVNALDATQQAMWEAFKRTLPTLANTEDMRRALNANETMHAPVERYQPPRTQIEADQRRALDASGSRAQPVVVNIGLDGFRATQTAIVNMEQGRVTDRTRTRIRAAR